ncbi:MAG: lipid-A-disaccharide synthase N-terminal domain-containing protein [Candidatus Omnitrophica bacterium]|nr:lipid-A-disaccharide synthase N-terminal domain-containing protein [Candidatus Omnitrophota bacterium]
MNSWSLNAWTILGLFGQLLFSIRFLIQWIVSEKKKESIIPVTFWYFSIAGSLVLLAYAFHIKSLVFILGQSVGSVIYTRNLMLINRKAKVIV